jgi:hypothetical protein
MIINSLRRLALLLATALVLSAFCAGQANDPIGIAAFQTYKNFESAVEIKNNAEIPSKYWTETIKAMQPEKIYLHAGNMVMVARIRDGAEEGWYFPTSPSFRQPYVGIRTEDGFTFADQNNGHGYPFIRTKRNSFAPDVSNGLFFAQRNYELAIKRGEEISPSGDLYEIPSKYWPDSLNAMNPIKIYMNGIDYAVVSRIQDGIEEGKYFIGMLSSDPIWSTNGVIPPRGEFILAPDPDSKTVNFKRYIGK